MDRGACVPRSMGVAKSSARLSDLSFFFSHEILVPRPGTEPTSPALQGRFLQLDQQGNPCHSLRGSAPPTSGLISTWWLAFDGAMGALALQENVQAKFSERCADCRQQEGPYEDRLILLQVTPLPLSRLHPWTQLFVGFAANFNLLFQSVLPVASHMAF